MCQKCVDSVWEVSSAHGFELTDEQLNHVLLEHTAFPFSSDPAAMRRQVEEFFEPHTGDPTLSFGQLSDISSRAYEAHVAEVMSRQRENQRQEKQL